MNVSIIVCSADCSSSSQGRQCIDPDTGEEGKDINHSNFNPAITASCPYVTVVGITPLSVVAAVTVSEVV